MDASTSISGTGSVSQSGTQQNLQNGTAPALAPATSNLQAGGNSPSTTNLNTSTTISGIPLSSISTTNLKPVPAAPPTSSHNPHLVGIGGVIIILAVIGLVISNIVSNRHLSID